MRTKPPKSARSKQPRPEKGNALPALKFFGAEFVLNTETGMFYRVTPTAMALLKAIQQGSDGGGLAEVVQGHSAVSRVTAVRDTELLINELSARGLLNSGHPA